MSYIVRQIWRSERGERILERVLLTALLMSVSVAAIPVMASTVDHVIRAIQVLSLNVQRACGQ